MSYVSVYNEANNLLELFLNKKINNYSKLRNYDYGKDDPNKVVSGLSRYISHGIIKEKDILVAIKKNKYKSDKFKQEILWRTYWKGWLEHHRDLWEKYKKALKREKIEISKSKKNEIYLKAISGDTFLKPFNYWTEQLINTGYLHNHARMWYASIWIHYFSLPWALGANFFYENLLDSDSASNTLSWRWVAGLHTKGKTYIAFKENIRKYTFDRFKNFKLPDLNNVILNENEICKNETNFKKVSVFENKKKTCLFVFENNLNLNFLIENNDFISEIILLKFNNTDIKQSIRVSNFKNKCCEDFYQIVKNKNVKINKIIIQDEISYLIEYLKTNKISEICYEFIPTGYEKDSFSLVKSKLVKENILLKETLDLFYFNAWKYCSRGYFNFKKNFIEFSD